MTKYTVEITRADGSIDTQIYQVEDLITLCNILNPLYSSGCSAQLISSEEIPEVE